MDNQEIAYLISKSIQPLFKKLPNELRINEKIAILKIRHENNYFLEKEISELDELGFDDYVKPNFKVTNTLLDSFLSRDQKSKIKKLCWVLNSKENYASKFKQSYEENKFKTVAEAVKHASKIYSKYCSNYNKNKATVSSQNGIKTVLKKRKIVEDTDSKGYESCQKKIAHQIQPTEGTSKHLITKLRCFESLKNNMSKIKDVLNYSKQELKTKLEEESESVRFATEAFGSIESTTLRDRLAIPIASIFYEMIDNFK